VSFCTRTGTFIADGEDSTPESRPSVSLDMLSTFLGYVHAFTVLDVKAQAVGYSINNGIIKFLVVPGIHEQELNLTEDVVQEFRAAAIADDTDECIARCWIHTRPTFEPYMTPEDVYQLYHYTCKFRPFFGIILSPREGIKALFLHMTDAGMDEIQSFCSEAIASSVDPRYHSIKRIKASTKQFCAQIRVVLCDDPCSVKDIRETVDISHQLVGSVGTGKRTWWQ